MNIYIYILWNFIDNNLYYLILIMYRKAEYNEKLESLPDSIGNLENLETL